MNMEIFDFERKSIVVK